MYTCSTCFSRSASQYELDRISARLREIESTHCVIVVLLVLNLLLLSFAGGAS
jgi:hypothetical protein